MLLLLSLKKGIPVFAWKNETEEDFWWCIEKTIQTEGWKPNLILDDGGDLTKIMHEKYAGILNNILGLSEETTTGVQRLYDMQDKRYFDGAMQLMLMTQ